MARRANRLQAAKMHFLKAHLETNSNIYHAKIKKLGRNPSRIAEIVDTEAWARTVFL
jgi:hypothetical protein